MYIYSEVLKNHLFKHRANTPYLHCIHLVHAGY